MKKTLAFILGAMLGIVSVLPASAALNAYDGLTYTDLLLPTVIAPADVATTNLGSAVDISKFKGQAAIVVSISGNLVSNNYGGHVYIQSSSTGSSLWTNITDKVKNVTGLTTNPAATVLKLDTGAQKRYIRAMFIATNAATTAASATLIAP